MNKIHHDLSMIYHIPKLRSFINFSLGLDKKKLKKSFEFGKIYSKSGQFRWQATATCHESL